MPQRSGIKCRIEDNRQMMEDMVTNKINGVKKEHMIDKIQWLLKNG